MWLMKFLRVAFILCLSIILPTSAYSIQNVIINQPDNIVSGDQISASFTLKPTQYQNYTSNPNGTIQISTTLENAIWTRITVIDGAASKQRTIRSQTTNLEGWDIAYPQGTFIYINFTLTGIAPAVKNTSTCTIIGIGEYNLIGTLLPGGSTKIDKTVISDTDLENTIHLAETDLKTLRANIDNATRNDFDTSAAEQLYKNAQAGIDYVKSLPFSKYPLGLARLQAIKKDIVGATSLVERECTQAEINEARKPASQADQIIAWFNERAKNYPGLDNLQLNQSLAAQQIDRATIAMNAGDYITARAQAQKGFETANQTYTEATRLQKRALDPLTPLWDNLWIGYVLIGVITLFLLFRKKKKRVKKDGNRKRTETGTIKSTGTETSNKEPARSTRGSSVKTGRVQQSSK